MKPTMKYASLDLGTVEAVFNKLGGLEGAAKFLRGELVVQPEPLDFIVRVDRSVKPTYPDWFMKLEHPELECSGPAEYNLQEGVEQWLHDDQKHGSITGKTIYMHLREGDALSTCLNLQDGLAIQRKGIAVFRKLFADMFLWGSVVQHRNGDLYVPSLCSGLGKEVWLSWSWVGNSVWTSRHPALRFRK